MFFFWGGGGLYFFLLLLFVFISPPPPPFIPTAQNLYIHPTSTPTDPTSAAPVASSPLYAWGAVGRGLHPHCWGADIPPPPSPHPPFTLGRAGRSCMLPEETFPSASSTLLLLVSIGFSFGGGGFVLIILLLPSQIKTHPASSVSHLVAGQQWGALAVGSFITCSVGFFFWGGGSVVWDFPPRRPYKHLAAPRWFLAPSSPAAPPPQGCWGGCSHSEARWARGRLWLCSHTATSLRSCWVTALKSKVLSWGSRAST